MHCRLPGDETTALTCCFRSRSDSSLLMSSAVPLYLSPLAVSTSTCNSKQVLQHSGTLCHSYQPFSLMWCRCMGQPTLSMLQYHNKDSSSAPLQKMASKAQIACRGAVALAGCSLTPSGRRKLESVTASNSIASDHGRKHSQPPHMHRWPRRVQPVPCLYASQGAYIKQQTVCKGMRCSSCLKQHLCTPCPPRCLV